MIEMERHSCPCCGNACPPRPPIHGPPVKDAIASLTQQLAEPHPVICPMRGHAGNYQGYSTLDRSAHCRCRMRVLYGLRLRLERIFDETED
jgi:hypothetical protein